MSQQQHLPAKYQVYKTEHDVLKNILLCDIRGNILKLNVNGSEYVMVA